MKTMQFCKTWCKNGTERSAQDTLNKSEATVLISELVSYVLISEPRSMWYVMWWFAAILDLRKPGVSPLSLLWSNIICQTSAQISSLRLGFVRKTFFASIQIEKRELTGFCFFCSKRTAGLAKVFKKKRGAKQDWLEKYDNHRTRTSRRFTQST